MPVLLSVGYSSCHWCHVLAHESFEDETVAAYMNEHFVNIKVDREERPDVDAVYMEAVQAATGQGGWPMTVFMTADAEPFYFGTYFPPEPRQGMPSFMQVLEGVRTAWVGRPEEVAEVAQRIVRDLAGRELDYGKAGTPGPEELARALLGLTREYDAAHGGFGGAPKFPPSMVLEFLLRHHARTGSEGALQMAADTCETMARGGIYDQLGGGFARYSVDREWVIPHFEKMLYDNALLCRVYAHLWRATGSDLARRVALETADFMVRELRTDQGGFASALDADSEDPLTGEHVEGAYYAWTPAQLREALGEADGDLAALCFGVTEEGTFEHGTSVLQLPQDGPSVEADRLAGIKERLLAARGRRPAPGRDDKIVAAWNGLAIAALAECGAYFERPDLVERATEAADLLVRVHMDGRARLSRTSKDGRVGSNDGVLEDYGDVAEGFLALASVTGEGSGWSSPGSSSTWSWTGSPPRTGRCTTRRTTPRSSSAGRRIRRTRPPRRGGRLPRARCSRTRRTPDRRRTVRRRSGRSGWCTRSGRGCRASSGTGCRWPRRSSTGRARWRSSAIRRIRRWRCCTGPRCWGRLPGRWWRSVCRVRRTATVASSPFLPSAHSCATFRRRMCVDISSARGLRRIRSSWPSSWA